LDALFPDWSYTGIDLMPEFISVAKEKLSGQANVDLMMGDFLETKFSTSFDLVIASGTFNYKIDEAGNEKLIIAAMRRAFELCKVGIAFDFLSDRVDYKLEHAHHSRPEDVLSIAYSLSRNLVLLNDYIPFEFCIAVHKDDGFQPESPTFHNSTRYLPGNDRYL
jgi:hypothetical protein